MKKKCKYCGKILKRKKCSVPPSYEKYYPNVFKRGWRPERLIDFNRREFCDKRCVGKYWAYMQGGNPKFPQDRRLAKKLISYWCSAMSYKKGDEFRYSHSDPSPFCEFDMVDIHPLTIRKAIVYLLRIGALNVVEKGRYGIGPTKYELLKTRI